MDIQMDEKPNPLESNEGQVIVTNFEELAASEAVTSSHEGENQVLGYLEVQPSSKLAENETAIFAQEYDFNGQQLYYQEGTEDGTPIIMVISRDQDIPSGQAVAHFVQSDGVNSTLSLEGADAKLLSGNGNITVVRSTIDESTVDSSALSECGTHVSDVNSEYPVFISREGLNEVSVINNTDISSSLWTYAAKGDEKEDGMEVVFIPHSKLASTLVLTEDERNQKLLEFACLAQKLEKPVTVEGLQSSNSVHSAESAQSMEIMSTEQQDQNVSSSCSQNPQISDTEYFPVANINMMEENDPNEGLDLSVNKTVQGVSVIHVTSSSDFTNPNQGEVLGYIEPEVINSNEVPANSHIDSGIKYSLIHNDLLPHTGHNIIENIEQHSVLLQSQDSESTKEFSIAEEQLLLEKPHGIKNTSEDYETQNSKEIVTNRLNSVLVYNKKELDTVKETHSQILVPNEMPNNDNCIDMLNSPDQCNLLNNLIPEEIKHSEQVDCIRKSVVTCKESNNYTDVLQSNSEMTDNSQEMEQNTEVNTSESQVFTLPYENENNIPFDKTEGVLAMQESSTKKSRRTIRRKSTVTNIESVVTVIKPPQRTYSRSSMRLNKSHLAVEKVPDTENPVSPLSPYDENNLIVIDEVNVVDEGCPYETSIAETLGIKKDSSNVKEQVKLKIDTDINENSMELFATQSLENESTADISQNFNNNNMEKLTSFEKTKEKSGELSESQTIISATLDNILDHFQFSESEKSSAKVNDIEILLKNNLPNETVLEMPENNTTESQYSIIDNASANSKILTPKKTYLQRKKIKPFNTEVSKPSEISTNYDADIELFAYDDLDNTSNLITNDVRSHSPIVDISNKATSSDEDSLLFSSNIRSKGSATYKRRKTTETQNTLSNSVHKTTNESVLQKNETKNKEKSAEPPAFVSNIASRGKRIRKPTIKSALNFSGTNQLQSDISRKVTTALDIESDIHKIKTSSPEKKTKSRNLSRYRNSEKAFYPNASVSYLKKTKLSKRTSKPTPSKSYKLEKSTSIPVPSLLIYSQANNRNLTRHQLHAKLDQYIFSDNDDTHSDDNQNYRGFVKDKRRACSLGSRSRKKALNSDPDKWDKFVKSTPGKSRKYSYLSIIKRKMKASVKSNEELSSVTSEPMSSLCTPSTSTNSIKKNQSPTSIKQELKATKRKLIESSSVKRNKPNEISIEFEESPTKLNESQFTWVLVQPRTPEPVVRPTLQCYICHEFECKHWDNLIFHQKECYLNSREHQEEEIRDMDRRLQIRGEGFSLNSVSTLTEDQENKISNEKVTKDVDCDDKLSDKNEKGFPYRKHDVVWVELKRMFWPAMVVNTYPLRNKIKIYIFDAPEIQGVRKHLTIDLEKVVIFNKKSCNYINEGPKTDLYKTAFLKAISDANKFANKMCLDDESVKSHFKDIDYSDEQSTVRSYNNDIEDDTILDNLNMVADIIKCVKDGNVNDHLIGILEEKVQSERHEIFSSDDSCAKAELANRPWFGPINDLKEQAEFYEYVFSLFQEKSRKEDIRGEDLCYVYQVWCPEAIVKTISILENIEANDAEKRFIELTRNATHYSSEI